MIETIPEALAGERLDRVVALVTGCSRSTAAGLVEQGAVTIGGRPVTAGKHRVAEGDVVEVDYEATGPVAPIADPSIDIVVVHEDADVVVIDKHAGLVVHPGSGHADGTLVNALLARYPEIADVGDPARPGIVHRLDRDTSGLLAVARTVEAYDALTAALAARQVAREYIALVHGRPDADEGMVDAPVGRSTRSPTRMTVSERGREARTRYEVVWRNDEHDVSLLRCTLETGRTHQIRVHLQAIGHPVVGDATYGGGRGGVRSPRVFLHAAHLAFAHPRTGERLELSSPLPPDLATVLDLL